MDERFRIVVRWAALILLGVAAGGLALIVGIGNGAMLTGAVVGFVCGVFVGATIWSTYVRSSHADELAGPGLFRAVGLGLFAMGIVVGALTVSVDLTVAIAAAAGTVALLLMRESGG